MKSNMRIGIGYDVHPLEPGRQLVLGGVKIPFYKGLEGWSDADVLTHAVIDALLGAAALGDIGNRYPPGDPKYKGISSLTLLEETKDKLAEAGWKIVNIDATVVAAAPKLSEYIGLMRERLGSVLGTGAGKVSVKAATGNGVGEIGKGEGMAAYAVAMIEGGKNEDL